MGAAKRHVKPEGKRQRKRRLADLLQKAAQTRENNRQRRMQGLPPQGEQSAAEALLSLASICPSPPPMASSSPSPLPETPVASNFAHKPVDPTSGASLPDGAQLAAQNLNNLTSGSCSRWLGTGAAQRVPAHPCVSNAQAQAVAGQDPAIRHFLRTGQLVATNGEAAPRSPQTCPATSPTLQNSTPPPPPLCALSEEGMAVARAERVRQLPIQKARAQQDANLGAEAVAHALPPMTAPASAGTSSAPPAAFDRVATGAHWSHYAQPGTLSPEQVELLRQHLHARRQVLLAQQRALVYNMSLQFQARQCC
mmetsp:Transcript_20445/g.51633  ORF Transcript_20445/g.51633 Transcript_20445/m.51633 type:complete len:309 (-) Transcript_20445:40-966(-)|eukprot:CAMPEP_0174926054 /NCGR_PEP_ID=MMETSP1355-20121228/9532_1 /TAXON_ID=464990 /ORGANISM="Hemiselmis tepida, Strain CCMP443" /LENGTH=308 /DNA_ID=CAMNT_0016172057 /DNA_START=86 /DNA_END=1012 /DNA_ORIENTATION=+